MQLLPPCAVLVFKASNSCKTRSNFTRLVEVCVLSGQILVGITVDVVVLFERLNNDWTKRSVTENKINIITNPDFSFKVIG